MQPNYKTSTMVIQTTLLPLAQLAKNDGQIEGLPANPRIIKDEKYQKLVASIKENPEMLSLRELLVYKHDAHYIIIGGNMRYSAMRELGYEEAPCKIIPEETTVEQLRAYTLKDNSGYGEWDWDMLSGEWEMDELEAAGIDLPFLDGEDHPTNNEAADIEEDDFDETTDEIKTRCQSGDIWLLGQHKLICGDSTKESDIERLLGKEMADLWITDPPYNVNYEGGTEDKLKIANDNMNSGDFFEFLKAAFTTAKNVLKPGCSFYIWYASREHVNFETALNVSGLTVREQLIWNKSSLVLGRFDYHFKHEPCQPAGTMVLTTKGEKAIETLTEEDRVIAFNPKRSQVLGYKNGGYAIKTASRDYDGLLYSITADGKTTRATDNHMFTIRFNANAKKNYCTYLMRRGNWWRVGITKCYDSRQFGLKTRFHQEKADEMWLLGLHADKVEAQVAEQIITVKYGIPYTIWEFDRFSKTPNRSHKHIENIYAALDLDLMRENAHRLLHDFGRSERFPLINEVTKRERFSTRVTAKIHACNLVPEVMQVPIPRDPAAHHNYEFVSISDIEFDSYKGRVYSLAVEHHEHYIADGICTHNCLYGWKDGASHNWYNDRSQTTVMDFEKPRKNDLHPTMKPVPLFAYQIANSSKKGDIVLDTFGGSGTTIIACENLGRKARCVELDPHYCDVIIARWEKLTGKEAVKL